MSQTSLLEYFKRSSGEGTRPRHLQNHRDDDEDRNMSQTSMLKCVTGSSGEGTRPRHLQNHRDDEEDRNMSQTSMLKNVTGSSGEGDSAKTPAKSQHSQHDSDLRASQQHDIQTSSLELDEIESSSENDDSPSKDDGDGDEQEFLPGNKQKFSFPRLSIAKIQINKRDKEKRAEDIISNITKRLHGKKRKRTHGGDSTGKKRRGTEGPINPQALAPDLQRETSISEGVPNTSESQSADRDNNEPGASQHSILAPAKADETLTELDLEESVTDRLERHESGFHVKLFECTKPEQRQMTPAIEAIIRPRQSQHVNQRISYMIFFYRNLDGPEIFVAFSGMAYLHVNQRSCPEFPKKIAKRLLEPKTIQLETRNVTGDTSQVRKQYIPDKGGTINIWDVIDVVVHKYVAKPKPTASLLQFCKTWQVKRPSIAIKNLSVEIMTRFPSIYDIQNIISHFANIDNREPTYQFGSSQTVEEDDETFAMFDFMQEEHKRETIKMLQENLYRRINRYILNKSEDNIQLSCDDLDLWLNASEYRLFLDTNSKRSFIKKWEERQPNFRDVLQALEKHIPSNEISGKMLHADVKMSLYNGGGKLSKKKQPITRFIQSNFASSPSKPYYYWCGKWLKIKLEYFQMLDESFKSVIKEQTISSADMMPLPWAYSRAGGEFSDKLTTVSFSLHSLHEFLTDFLPNKEVDFDSQDTEKLLKQVSEVEEVEGGIVCSYQPRDYEHDEDQLKSLVQIFLRMNTPLTEGMYNDSYILLDKIISTTEEPLQTGFLVGDRLLINNIEMFDIIMYNQTHTYIIHVKEGFDNNTRVVASQIRNSADILFRALTCQMTKTFLDEMWDTFTSKSTKSSGRKSQPTLGQLAKKEGMHKNRCAMKSKLEKMTKEGFMRLFEEREIVYVLAARDKSEDRSMETDDAAHDAMVAQFQKRHPTNCEIIMQLLEAEMYVEKKHSHHVVTDRFRYANQKSFLKDMMVDALHKFNQSEKEEKIHDSNRIASRGLDKQIHHASSSAESSEKSVRVTEDASPRHSTGLDIKGLDEDLWKGVYAILFDQLSNTKSSIVKLDLLSLLSHFRKYQIGERKFQLKVCFIPKSSKHFREKLKTFLRGLKC